MIHVARGTGGAEMAKELEAISLLDIYQRDDLGRPVNYLVSTSTQIQLVRLEIASMVF